MAVTSIRDHQGALFVSLRRDASRRSTPYYYSASARLAASKRHDAFPILEMPWPPMTMQNTSGPLCALLRTLAAKKLTPDLEEEDSAS